MNSNKSRSIDFVIKVSKLCNLRCSYCYEFNELHKKDFISLENLELLYENVYEFITFRDEKDNRKTTVNFIWHGGEPLLINSVFYRETFELQKRIFTTKILFTNSMQTNLTVLDKDRIELIKKYNINLGVSIDVFGELRINKGGKSVQDKVLRNMDKLKEQNIRFACIVVLTKENLGKETEIFDFFYSTYTDFRVLPLFKGAFEEQHDKYDLSSEDVIISFERYVDLLSEKPDRIKITPISEYIMCVLKLKKSFPRNSFYDKYYWPPVLLVNTNGDCYGYGDPYNDANFKYGNIFTTPLLSILQSEGFNNSAIEAKKRVAYNCVPCKYFGYCDGYHIAESHEDIRDNNSIGIKLCKFPRSTMNYIDKTYSAEIMSIGTKR